MAARAASVKRYVVRLSADERRRLDAMIHKGKSSAARLLKARILLKADVSEAGEGWSDSRIVEAVETSVSMVYRVRRQLVEEGLEAVLSRKAPARPSVPRIFDGEREARLIALACSKPPEGHARWSLRLLESKVVELGIVEAASNSTIQRVLKKTRLNRTAANTGSFCTSFISTEFEDTAAHVQETLRLVRATCACSDGWRSRITRGTFSNITTKRLRGNGAPSRPTQIIRQHLGDAQNRIVPD